MSKADAQQLVRAMERRTKALTPELRMAWAAAVQQLRQQLTDDRVAQLITSGRIDELLTPEVLDDAMRDLRRGMASGLQAGSASVIGTLPEVAQIAFSVRANPRVLEAIRTLDSNLLHGWKRDARATVRTVVEQGLRDGVNPRAVARDLREAVGLAPHQLDEVRNYRKALEDRLAMARTTGKLGGVGRYTLRDKRFDATVRKRNYTPAQIDTMVDRYAARRTADHANTIARTAALNANRSGQDAAFRSAIDGGLVDPARSFKTWRSVGDSRVRDDHKAMNGERVRYNEAFTNGQQYPNEYNCRCLVEYTMVTLDDGGRTTSANDLGALDPDEARRRRNEASRRSKAKAKGKVVPPIAPPVVVKPPVIVPPVVVGPVVGPPDGLTDFERKRLARNEASRKSKAKARAARTGTPVSVPTPGANPVPALVRGPADAPYGARRANDDVTRQLLAPQTPEEKAFLAQLKANLIEHGNPSKKAATGFTTPYHEMRSDSDRADSQSMFRKAMMKLRGAKPATAAEARQALPIDLDPKSAKKWTNGDMRMAADKVMIRYDGSTVENTLDTAATWLADVMGVPPSAMGAKRSLLTYDPKTGGAYFRPSNRDIVLGTGADAGTLVHEFMHYMQNEFLGIKAWEDESRSLFTTSKNTMNIAPMLGYTKENMTGWLGNFFTGYQGRVYPSQSSEWLTVGIQAIYYDPASMAKFYPELFDEFVLFMSRVGTRKVFHK